MPSRPSSSGTVARRARRATAARPRSPAACTRPGLSPARQRLQRAEHAKPLQPVTVRQLRAAPGRAVRNLRGLLEFLRLEGERVLFPDL